MCLCDGTHTCGMVFSLIPPANSVEVADLHVVYEDGTSETISDVRYRTLLSDPNPVKVNGSTVEVETHHSAVEGFVITLLNVRRYNFV